MKAISTAFTRIAVLHRNSIIFIQLPRNEGQRTGYWSIRVSVAKKPSRQEAIFKNTNFVPIPLLLKPTGLFNLLTYRVASALSCHKFNIRAIIGANGTAVTNIVRKPGKEGGGSV